MTQAETLVATRDDESATRVLFLLFPHFPLTSAHCWTTPQPGEGFWYLQRAVGGRYADDDAAQVGSPDEEINASPSACP